MTDVSVLIPWTPGCPWRERAWAWTRGQFASHHPGWEIVTGTSPDGPYSRAAAILDAASTATGSVLVIADADIWCDPAPAVAAAAETGWAIPHRLIHRLSPESTDLVLAGADWHGLPLSTDNEQDRRPYVGHPTGTLVAMTRETFDAAPPDPRFAGWGQEDDAWATALRTLVGPAWRGTDDLVHLWHPAQPRKNRVVGTDANLALFRRYRAARHRPEAMRELLDEARVAA